MRATLSPITRGGEPDRARDRTCSVRMIARHHDHANAGGAALRDRLRHLRARRVFQADETREHEPALPLLARRAGRQLAPGEREDAKPTLGHLVHRLLQALAQRGVEGDSSIRGLHRDALRNDDLGRALAVEQPAARALVHRGHAAPVRVERQLVGLGRRRSAAHRALRHLDERRLHGVAEQALATVVGHALQAVAVQGDIEKVALPPRRPGVERAERMQAIGEPGVRRAHAVLGERSGLVGDDDGRRAERLGGGQVPDQRAAPRHALGGHRERERHSGEQALGHVGDDDADREQQVRPEAEAEELTDGEKNDAERGGEKRHEARDARNLLLQRRRRLEHRLGELRDAAELGAHPGRVHHGARFARDDRGAGKQEVARAQGVALGVGTGAARLGQRLAGDGGDIDAQPERLDHAAVGGDVLALLHEDHVARHQCLGGEAQRGAVAQHRDLVRQQRPQRRDRAFGARLLPESERAVHRNHADDRRAERRHALARLERRGGKRKPRGDPEDEREEICELARDAQQRRFAPCFLDAVRTVFGRAPFGFARGETVPRRAQAGERFVDAEAGDVHCVPDPNPRPSWAVDVGQAAPAACADTIDPWPPPPRSAITTR
jgi:hypothetical protein